MPQLWKIGSIKDILSRHGFTFSKALGQNFLINPTVCPRMAEVSGVTPDSGVIEVGPGIGVLTAELSRRARKVVAIELDDRLLPVLEETLGERENVTVVHGDILKIDLKGLIEREFAGMEVCLCANLPYYITSQVIMRLLEERLPLRSITVMVQKEAAARLCAPLGSRECGAVTVAVRYFSEPRVVFGVSAGGFLPAPKVDSAVIQLAVRERPPVEVESERAFFRVVKAAFAGRRKTAVNSLSMNLGLPKETVSAAFAGAGIAPTARAENLSMEQLAALAAALFPQTGSPQGEKER